MQKELKKISSNQFIFWTIVVLIFIYPLLIIISRKDAFFARVYDKEYPGLKKLYYESQYTKKNPTAIIPDEIFEAFAGGIFLKGLNPILIVHDHPPLGRYLVSLSIAFFNNASTLMIPMYFLSSLGLFLVSRLTLKNNLLALIPVAFFTNEPLMISHLVLTPLSELTQLPFIFFTFYFFLKSINDKKYLKWFVLESFGLGVVVSTRFFILGLCMMSVMIAFFVIKKEFNKKLIHFILMQPLSLVVLFLSYSVTIIDGYSLVKVLGVQKYIFLYHKSAITNPLSFWDLLIFNRWHTWWGSRAIQHDSQWNIVWPLSVFITILGSGIFVIKKINFSDPEKLILLWVVFYSLMLSVGYTSVRYFLPILPFFYILAIAFSSRLVASLKVNEKN